MAPDPLSPVPVVFSAPGAPIRDQLQTLATRAADAGDHDVVLDALRMLSLKPGVKTTEFYVSLLCCTIGTALQLAPGREVVGAVLIAVGTLAYNLSRGLAKQGASSS